jgi:uncharacterized protein
MAGDLHISWEEYNKKIEELAMQIHTDGYKFNQIVCIAKGGLRVGDIISRIFDVPLAILSVESYTGDGVKDTQGSITFSRDLAKTTPNIGSKVLLVDDLADSGVTLEKTLEWLEHYYGFYMEEVRTAVIWSKAISKFKPYYAVEYLKGNPWIHQPFEIYETMDIDTYQAKDE